MRLTVEKASKSFPGVKALDGVSLDLRPGEIHALMGENGAGKSTLIKIITGVYQPDEGRVMLDGSEVRFASPRDALAAGISAVHQERNLVPRFTVGENIALERLPTRNGLIDYAQVDREARRYLDLLDRGIDTRAEVRTLSVAQMQIVEIAKALSLEAKILLLDEPTASITEHETAALFALLRRLREEGVAMLFVSHKLEEVFTIADRVTVLRDGRNASDGVPMAEMTRQKLVSQMIGREERIAKLRDREVDNADVVMEAKGLSTSDGHHDISFRLHRREILGFYGLVGAGRSELMKAMLGGAVTGGELTVNGKPARIRDMHEALGKYRIGYVSEDRKGEGLVLIHSVKENVAITIWQRIARFLGLIPPGTEARAVQPFVDRLEVRTPSLNQTVGNLSGGNQQKVSIAKWLAANAGILIVDEPTVGIDIKTKTDIHELLGEIAREGVSIILISSDMPEMVAVADRILVMHGFRIVGEVANDHQYENASKAIMARIHAVEEEEAASAG
ncbi:MAG: sugar ABC transporter ATP-binding protein [Bauldia sp.]|uniref:sugar ABC transporter ATP-binding protein n=1 Tax=Bauldia sp. TaxID=2575872 RepID=UPI001D2CE3EF|nr:sugar ABC transporter ATP-binding protein [Bauldia sp.]MCB1496087.1 sugar ABC transporter ATP-binding protein [Bauldia sp.]